MKRMNRGEYSSPIPNDSCRRGRCDTLFFAHGTLCHLAKKIEISARLRQQRMLQLTVDIVSIAHFSAIVDLCLQTY
uniref:Uncharacterized protein n=1 Tax=Romanomermis culicivorax TaxID=13658 RepID=A0A915HWC3_ROMCU